MSELTIRGAQAQRNLLEWSQCVAVCRSSGLSVSHWCAEHDIKPKTYFNWQKKVFAAMIEQQRQQLETSQGPEQRFTELPAPVTRNDLVASVRVGETIQPIGTEVQEKIQIIPAKVILHRDVYVTCACLSCTENGINTPILNTSKESALIPGSFALAEAVAHIAVQKFGKCQTGPAISEPCLTLTRKMRSAREMKSIDNTLRADRKRFLIRGPGSARYQQASPLSSHKGRGWARRIRIDFDIPQIYTAHNAKAEKVVGFLDTVAMLLYINHIRKPHQLSTSERMENYYGSNYCIICLRHGCFWHMSPDLFQP